MVRLYIKRFLILIGWRIIKPYKGSRARMFFFFFFLDTSRPRQNDRHFADDTFKRIFMNDKVRISIKISLKLVP